MTERELNSLAKRWRMSRSDVVREAIARWAVGDAGDGAGGSPYDSWQDVVGVVRLGARDPALTSGEQFAAVVRQRRGSRRAR